jgi:phage FluMu protein Com
MIKFLCPQCNKPLVIADEFAGMASKCSSCSSLVTVPEDIDSDAAILRKRGGKAQPNVAQIFVSIALLLSLIGFIYFLLFMPMTQWAYHPSLGVEQSKNWKIPDPEAPQRQVIGLIGFGIASALCLGGLFYLRSRARIDAAGR